MSIKILILRSATYHWRTNIAVALGVAAAVSVLGGALLVGDSVRGSLRDLVLSRLGRTGQVVSSMGYFRDALAKYRRRDFSGAGALFGQVLAVNPDDKAAQLYVERCERLSKDPPPEDWGGVYRMDHK